ncbi:MAG: hypothetical protein JWR02_2855 [Mucilaginibacter sp.]|nr:hypothetical protein [Mucilaginibacter sp.]
MAIDHFSGPAATGGNGSVAGSYRSERQRIYL